MHLCTYTPTHYTYMCIIKNLCDGTAQRQHHSAESMLVALLACLLLIFTVHNIEL